MSSASAVWGMPLLQWLVVVTLLSGGVFVVVRGLDAGLARLLAPRVRMALYALVLLRVVLPPDFSTPVGMLGGGEPAPDIATRRQTPLEAPAIAVPWLSRAQPAASVEASASAPAPAPAPAPVSPLWLAWLVGAAAVLGVAGARRRHLVRIVAQSQPADTALAGPGRAVRVLVHPTAGPLAAGLRDKVIVLPRALVESLPDEALSWVVAHERAHHEGHDPWLASALTLLTALAWPVLPVWLAARRVRALIEHAADERAVALVAGERRRYGRVLLDLVAEAPARPVAVGLGAYRDLRSRIAAILRPTTTPVLAQLAVAGAVAGAVVACAAMPVDDELDPMPRVADCDALKETATLAHDRWEKERDIRQWELAAASYDEYIDACADDPSQEADYGTMIYYAAEAHWSAAVTEYNAGNTEAAERGWERARALFDRVIDEGGEKFRNDAAYAQFLSVRNAARWDPRDEAAACDDCEPLAFVPYDDAEREVLAAWDRFVGVLGRPTKASAKELLDMARLRMQHNDFSAARPDLEELAGGHAGTEAGLSGAEMLVDVLTIEWTRATPEDQAATGETLAAWLRRIEDSATWSMEGAARLREATPTLLAGVAWRAAMHELAAAEASGEPDAYRRCADAFTALADAHPDHDQVETMRRNAATCAASAG